MTSFILYQLPAAFAFRAMFWLWLILLVAAAMILHEFGHVISARVCRVSASEIGFGIGPKIFSFSLRSMRFTLRALPAASFVRLDSSALRLRPIPQQLFVHLGGILLNFVAGVAMYGTLFGWINLALAAGNLLPLYKHDGWKCGVVIVRRLLRKESRPVELVFTFSGGLASLLIIASLLQILK